MNMLLTIEDQGEEIKRLAQQCDQLQQRLALAHQELRWSHFDTLTVPEGWLVAETPEGPEWSHSIPAPGVSRGTLTAIVTRTATVPTRWSWRVGLWSPTAPWTHLDDGEAPACTAAMLQARGSLEEFAAEATAAGGAL